MEIFYENSRRERLNMDNWPIVIQDITELFSWDWKHEASELAGKNASKLETFYRKEMQKKLKLSIFAESEDEYKNAMNRIGEVTEVDIANQIPGKLWVNEYYLKCFIVAEDIGDYEENFYAADNTITIISFHPFWVKEHEKNIKSNDITSTNNKRYPLRYIYRYANGLVNTEIINGHFKECNFKMILYGPVVKPMVIIGGYEYYVDIILEEKEYLEIDSAMRTITKVMNKGTRVNAFHNQNKEKSVFRPIQPGKQEITWTGKFDFDIVIYEERSSPKW